MTAHKQVVTTFQYDRVWLLDYYCYLLLYRAIKRMSIAEAQILVRLRWQIELLFKLWKTYGQVDEWHYPCLKTKTLLVTLYSGHFPTECVTSATPIGGRVTRLKMCRGHMAMLHLFTVWFLIDPGDTVSL